MSFGNPMDFDGMTARLLLCAVVAVVGLMGLLWVAL